MRKPEEDPIQRAKARAAIAAAALVESRQIVGIGTGSTAELLITELGRRVREEKLSIVGIPTSFRAAMLARAGGIPIRTLDDVDEIDIAIDGADEIDPQRNLIKGGGGALTREKVVASAAKLFVVIADDSKMVKRLGERAPVPVEVIPMAISAASRRLRSLGGDPDLRLGSVRNGPVVTEGGNFILDVRFYQITDPAALEREIDRIPGVLESGLFIQMAAIALIGRPRSETILRI
jgi:ribose 5-phosphate isomerase A